MDAIKLEVVNLKKHPTLSEAWVHQQIYENPAMLGLGDLEARDKERRQVSGGRLDLLLSDPATLKRYEVEIQLGQTDESHIIRTIEYWDIERKRYPQYEHVAVIVAENITSRFLNVLHLFNGQVPLIAVKMTAYKVGEGYALTFVKVVDERSLGLVDEDEPVAEATDRSWWEAKASKPTLTFIDELLAKIVKPVESKAVLKYNKHYIGLGVDGTALNFVSFTPKKAHVIVAIRLPKSPEDDATIEAADLDELTYDAQFKQYRFRVEAPLKEEVRVAFAELAGRARANRK